MASAQFRVALWADGLQLVSSTVYRVDEEAEAFRAAEKLRQIVGPIPTVEVWHTYNGAMWGTVVDKPRGP
jgi:hypothetical protein